VWLLGRYGRFDDAENFMEVINGARPGELTKLSPGLGKEILLKCDEREKLPSHRKRAVLHFQAGPELAPLQYRFHAN